MKIILGYQRKVELKRGIKMEVKKKKKRKSCTANAKSIMLDWERENLCCNKFFFFSFLVSFLERKEKENFLEAAILIL